jgi:hypothetical protein
MSANLNRPLFCGLLLPPFYPPRHKSESRPGGRMDLKYYAGHSQIVRFRNYINGWIKGVRRIIAIPKE